MKEKWREEKCSRKRGDVVESKMYEKATYKIVISAIS